MYIIWRYYVKEPKLISWFNIQKQRWHSANVKMGELTELPESDEMLIATKTCWR